MAIINLEKFKKYLFYKEGKLYWKISPQYRIKPGDLAGTVNKQGYYKVKLQRKSYFCHRIIYAFHHNFFPKEIDHIDGNPSNNFIENLRQATHSENLQNQKEQKIIRTSSMKGVDLRKNGGRYVSRIGFNGKRIYLGIFDSEIDAAIAYNKAAKDLYKNYARVNEVNNGTTV